MRLEEPHLQNGLLHIPDHIHRKDNENRGSYFCGDMPIAAPADHDAHRPKDKEKKDNPKRLLVPLFFVGVAHEIVCIFSLTLPLPIPNSAVVIAHELLHYPEHQGSLRTRRRQE